MKTIILDAGPRKGWNTAQLLASIEEGARSAGDEVERINLFDVDFKGCRSCLLCKRTGIDNPCKCYWKDDFAAIVEKVYAADRLFIGSPIYFSEPTGTFRNALERICFPLLSYDNYQSLFKGKVDVTAVFTMNAPESTYKQNYEADLAKYLGPFNLLKGKVSAHTVFDTMQVKDYSKFDMAGLPGEHKTLRHQEQFPAELKAAYELGASRG